VIETDGIVACEICLREIPRSVAHSHEGAEYVYHFCGAECYQRWVAAPPMQEIALTVSGVVLDFAAVQALARLAAGSAAPEPMLLAWYDRRRGQESPQVPECQHKPGWLAYAESHGGDIRVDVNDGEYVFIFAAGARAGE
jgi:hypothetical protein